MLKMTTKDDYIKYYISLLNEWIMIFFSERKIVQKENCVDALVGEKFNMPTKHFHLSFR